MENVYILYFYIILNCFTVNGIDVPMIDKNKAALRYGFQNIRDCQDHEKAFLCVTKCLDLQYDVAHADKNCDCTCYFKKDKAKYKILNVKSTKWRLGTPTTSKPAWAHSSNDQKTDLGAQYQENIQHLSSNEHNGNVSFVTIATENLQEVTDTNAVHDNITAPVDATTNAGQTVKIENQDNTEIVNITQNPDKKDNNENAEVTEKPVTV